MIQIDPADIFGGRSRALLVLAVCMLLAGRAASQDPYAHTLTFAGSTWASLNDRS